MLLKSVVFAILAVAVLADDTVVSDEKHSQLREMLRTLCKKNNAEDKVDEIMNVGKSFSECVKGLIDMPTIQREIEAAKPNGALDEVFKKYCAKSSQLKTCIHTALDGVSPCLDTTAREQLVPAKNSTDDLIDFVCYKDGDRIALFISEGGPQCFQEKVIGIRDCANNVKDSMSTIEDANALTLTERCGKFDELTNCIVTKLESCSTPTPGNMAESLFRFVRKGSPCKDIPKI